MDDAVWIDVNGFEVSSEDLVSYGEIAERAAVGIKTVTNDWFTREGFPGPLFTRSGMNVYYWPAISAWLEQNGFRVILPPLTHSLSRALLPETLPPEMIEQTRCN